jgi:hypothetical protein
MADRHERLTFISLAIARDTLRATGESNISL